MKTLYLQPIRNPSCSHSMNRSKFTKNELNELEQIVKRKLREKTCWDYKQVTDAWNHGKRESKSMRKVYTETTVSAAFDMAKSHSIWTQAIWQRQMLKEKNSGTNEAVSVMNEVDKTKRFDGKKHDIGKRSSGFGMETNMEESKGRDEKGCNKDKV